MKYFAKISMVFLALLSTGCGSVIVALTSRVFEIDDYSIFSIHCSSTSPREVILRGKVLHSAVGAYKIEARQEDGRTLRIIIHGALMNEYIEVKGVLNYTISVPDSIDTITIGNKKTIIWNKGDGHQGLRTWRFGREVRERDENEHNHSDMETK